MSALKHVAGAATLLAAAVFVFGTIFLGLTWRPHQSETFQQEVLRIIGGGAYWESCGAPGCSQAMTGAGAPAYVIALSDGAPAALEKALDIGPGSAALLIYPQDSRLDQRIITDLGGRKAYSWVQYVKELIAKDGNGVATNDSNYFGDREWTVFTNENFGRTEIVFS